MIFMLMSSFDFWEGVHTNKLAFDHLFGREFVEIEVSHYLSEIHIPITILMGKYDFQVAPDFTWDPILKDFQKVQFWLFEKSAHLPFFEEPERFVSIIKKIPDTL